MAETKLGRPSMFTQDMAAEICSRLADGESLRSICADDHMPSKTTVCNWLFDKDKADFLDQYARAREMQAELMADELNDIADDGTNDWMRTHGEGSVGWKANGEAIQRSKLRIDTRKWIAAKLLPKKYGERTTIDQTLTVNNRPPNEYSDDELAAIAAGGRKGTAGPAEGAEKPRSTH